MTLISVLDYLGVAASASRASLTVARRGMDIIAVLVLATVAGLGGGTLRDLLISKPVFWSHYQGYLLACIVPAVLVWSFAAGQRSAKLLDVCDAIGLGAYAVVGCLKAWNAGVAALGCVAVGTLAATWGGLMREVLVGDATILVRKEVYITAALAACLTFLALKALGLADLPSAIAGAAAGACLRLAALQGKFEMPAPPYFIKND